LAAAGISDDDVARMAKGQLPANYVHHIQALSQGGTNAEANLVLLHKKPEHAAITYQQITATNGLKVGQANEIDILVPPVDAKVYAAPSSVRGSN
jgi:hypothetical protein